MDHIVDESFTEKKEPLKEYKQTDNWKPEIQHYVVLAGFWIRLWAYILDMVVVGSLHRIFIYPLFRMFDIPLSETSMFSTIVIATAAVMYAYFILMTKFFGQTLGKMVFGMKVIHENSQKLTWSTVIFRELIGKFISKTVLFLGFIAILLSSKKQGWHDYFADTIVIQERKGFLIPYSRY
ncbi:RDD family protein [Calidifontibacillus erzurumensis]|uniref:RDD family protein n=1 Tax=Calidifontibacillus erzurumensis TaxID=2741433 RepID=UPI002E76CAFF|nr:RDD family protein [Calidifontibacillus erzurumensis]